MPENGSKILFVQTAFLGDLLLSIPLLRRLRKQFPKHSIAVVCRKGVGQPLLDLNIVDEIFEITKSSGSTYDQLANKLNSEKFDYIFCPHESLRSALFVRKLTANHKVAFQQWWNFLFFNHLVKKNKKHPEAIRQMSLLMPFDHELKNNLKNFSEKFLNQKNNIRKLDSVPEWAMFDCLPEIPNTNEKVAGDYVCIFPGSVWNTKKWTEKGFLEVAQWFNEQKMKVVFMGGPDEKDLCQRIADQVPGSVNFAGKTSLTEGISLLKSARLCLSNDSAGQHMAAVAGTPTVSIFGPTTIEQGYRPWNSNAVTVELSALECRPCGRHGHNVCPIKTHQCMKGIPASQVIEAVKTLLPI